VPGINGTSKGESFHITIELWWCCVFSYLETVHVVSSDVREPQKIEKTKKREQRSSYKKGSRSEGST